MNPSATTTANDPAVLHGDGRYGFTARVEGNDLVVTGVRATWFGGAHDPYDNGQTASGLSTRLHPDLLGCALPMSGHRLTRGSPLPDLPWMTTAVRVTCPATGKSATLPLVDLGPAAPPHAHAAIDLTRAAFRALGGDPVKGELTVDFRISGGALRLPAAQLLAARAVPSHGAAPIPRAARAQTVTAVVSAAAPAAPLTTPVTLPPGGTAAGRVGLAVPPSSNRPS